MTLVGSPVFASGVKATFTTSSIYLAGHVWIPRHFGGIQARLGLRSHCDADCKTKQSVATLPKVNAKPPAWSLYLYLYRHRDGTGVP